LPALILEGVYHPDHLVRRIRALAKQARGREDVARAQPAPPSVPTAGPLEGDIGCGGDSRSA
jgi:hypothetical protein